MQLNPYLLQQLELEAPNHLKQLLLWFNVDTQSLESQSQQLNAILSEIDTMTADICYQTLSELEVPEMVRLSLLNEFGPAFAQKAIFPLLESVTSQRVNRQ